MIVLSLTANIPLRWEGGKEGKKLLISVLVVTCVFLHKCPAIVIGFSQIFDSVGVFNAILLRGVGGSCVGEV